MVLGWRRAFCTSIPKEQDSTSTNLDCCMEDYNNISSHNSTPKIGSRFGFFTTNSSSNPSTPRIRSHSVSTSPPLVCRTVAAKSASVPVSPKLHCETKNSPRFLLRSSTPSSPRSPSPFSFLKSTLRLNTRRCGLCLQSIKKGQGMATFTAECCHTFHFPCVSDYVKRQGSLACPVCSSLWKEMPHLSFEDDEKNNRKNKCVEIEDEEEEKRKVKLDTKSIDDVVVGKHLLLKVYNDDEPLVSLTPKARFNPIPESDENCDEDLVCEFQGFNVTNSQTESNFGVNEVEIQLSPEAAVVATSRRHQTYVIVMKVKAPAAPERTQNSSRAPVDLVTVVDVSSRMSIEKLEVVKKAMKLIITSLSSSDRLSIVAFSTYSKRLLPLRRMTPNGRRAARRIVEAMAVLEGVSNSKDAVKKGVKVLEDRKEKNPIANIILLSEVVDRLKISEHERFVSSTRYPWPNISIHSVKLVIDGDVYTLSKLIGNLLNVMVQGVELELRFSSSGVIAAVYTRTPQPTLLGSSTVKIGDMFGDEEKELYIEVKGSLSSSVVRSHQVLSVRCRYRESCVHESIYGKQQTLMVPRPQSVRSSLPSIQRLRNLFISTRALAESHRLADRTDLVGAYHMLVSARVLMLQSKPANDDEFVLGLEAELSELQRRRKASQSQVRRRGKAETAAPVTAYTDEKGEPLTPTSAWRVADKLAKVAMMRKSVNRVSDLHGFEDARF
uniref:E3 ubiquitin-protein ligase WAV3-like n=1 Tax=Erigeron canadensis TaxID=72917 RepID=UPI001CB9C171|nr:E3 ubiquitin-protein ligase WAV3-like [Erigeron canadensis]